MLQLDTLLMDNTVGLLQQQKIVLCFGNAPMDKSLIIFLLKLLSSINPFMLFTITSNIMLTFNQMIQYQAPSLISKIKICGKVCPRKLFQNFLFIVGNFLVIIKTISIASSKSRHLQNRIILIKQSKSINLTIS